MNFACFFGKKSIDWTKVPGVELSLLKTKAFFGFCSSLLCPALAILGMFRLFVYTVAIIMRLRISEHIRST